MGTIKEEAEGYEPKQTKTIADLEVVPINLVIKEDSFEVEENGEVKTVDQKVVTIEGEVYRVPNSVLKDLKVMLEDNPDLTSFKVKKTGEGMKTSYTVIPL